MKRSLLKLMILSMVMIASMLSVTASASNVGVATMKITSIEGTLDALEVDYDESIPLPYTSLQEMLDDNENFTIHTNTSLNDISLTHDRDEIYNDDPDPLYIKYKRYYILTDENDDDYEVSQMILKKTTGGGTMVIATASKDVVLYHADDDLSDYNGGMLFNDNYIMNYLETYFPQMNSILNQYCEEESTMTYSDYKIAEGNINDRCYTVIRRTHYIDRECGSKYRYVAIVNFRVLHYNQSIQVSGIMDTIKIKEGQSFPSAIMTVQSLMSMNSMINIQASSLNRIELVHVGDQFVSSIPGRNYYTRTYRLIDKCDENVTAVITQPILENGTVNLGTGYHDSNIYHGTDNLMDYKDGALYYIDVINQYLNEFFSEGIALLEENCPGAEQSVSYNEEVFGTGDISERCNTLVRRTHVVEREKDGITYRYVAVLNININHSNEDIVSLGHLQKIKLDYEEPKPEPYANINELLSKNPTIRIEALKLENLLVTSYDEVVVEDENRKEYLRHYTVKDKCDEEISVELTQEILLTNVVVVGESETEISFYHIDDDFTDYNAGILYDELGIYQYLDKFAPEYDTKLDEYCDSGEQYLAYEDTREVVGPIEQRCSTTMKRVHNIDRVCDDVTYRYIVRANFDARHYNDFSKIKFEGGHVLKAVEIDGWDNEDVPVYNTVQELLADNPDISITDAINIERLALKVDEDKLLTGDEEEGDCEFVYMRTYHIVDPCTLEDDIANNDIENTYTQDITVTKTLKVEGPLKTVYYQVYEDTEHDGNHISIFNYLKSQGLKYKAEGLDLNDIYITNADTWDDKYPGAFDREYTIHYRTCGTSTITQRYELDLTFSIECDPPIVAYKACGELKDYAISDMDKAFSLLEKFDNWNPEYMTELTFDYPPFNEYEGNYTFSSRMDVMEEDACYALVRYIFSFYYEYYGHIYKAEAVAYLELNACESPEDASENYPVQVLELPNDTVYGCTGESCLPEPKTKISEFAEIGVVNHQICGSDDLVLVEYQDEKIEGDDCSSVYRRTYLIGDMCNEVLWYEVTQDIILKDEIIVDGFIKTEYYTESPSEPVTTYGQLVELGARIKYGGNNKDLIITSEDVDVEGVRGRIKRNYCVRTSCEDVMDTISQYLVKKFQDDGAEFEVVEVNNVSSSGSNDGSILLRVPSDELCDGCTKLTEAFDFIFEDNEGNAYEITQKDEQHMIAENLPAGEYFLAVYPANIERKKALFSYIGKITEMKMGIAAIPWMSFSAYNFYVETFGHHYFYKDDDESGESGYIYIQNEDNTEWDYYFTVDGGDLINSVWDGGESFQFYPSIQSNYESNSMVYRPGKTIQLTMNADFITFHAFNKAGKEMKNKRIIHHAKICLSNDPNEIFGPAGYGENKMISTNDRIDYKIMFENDPELATAAAARVKVTCPLHPHADPTTVRLGQYGFGDYIFEVPPMSTYYNKRLDLADSLGVWLDVSAGIDVDKNEMYWILQSIDPETGVAPTDAIGFLPVNDTLTGCGEGFVTFSVMSIDDMKTGDTISEQANIIFDENDNILTNTYTNMFDAVAPTSVSVCDSSSVLLDYNLIFKSVATDDENGSGVRQVDLYVNVDNTQYVLAGSMYPDTIGSADTMSLSYRLGQGSLYQFVLQAVDNVGNKEAFSETAQITFVNNNPPLDIYLSNRYFYEDDEIGTVIGKFSTLDDQTSNTFTYSLVDEEDYDNDLFIIEGDKLKLNMDLRCYGQYMYKILVKTEDVNGECFDKAFILYAEQTMTPPTTLVDHYLCHGDFIEIAGEYVTEDGYYYDTIPTMFGCDSIVKHIVKHRPDPVVISYDEYICMYEDYDSHGFELTWENIQERLEGWQQLYDTTLVLKRDSINVYGCTDTVRVDLTVYPASRTTHDVIACADAMPFQYGDSLFVAAGTKDVVFTSVITGCDSIVTVNLEVAPSHFDVPVFATICDNEYYMLFEDTIREAGTYYKMGQSVHHCDSSVVLTLEVLPTKYGVDYLDICSSELPYTYGNHTFDESTVSGSYPVIFNAVNSCDSIVTLNLTVRQEGDQYNNFSGTWDWFSTYIDDEHTDVLSELKSELSSYGKTIKSNTGFVNFAGGVWSGNLDSIRNEQMYMVQTSELQNTQIDGCVANPSEHPITIKKGWNHIGYISEYTSDVNTALAGLNVTPQDGDIIKSYREGFSVYFESFGMWFGDMTQLKPGQGYQYLSFNDDDITLVYPQMSQNRGEEKSAKALKWSPTYKYPDNMTFIADIVVDDLIHDSDTLEVGAFCNGEKRGNARAVFIKAVGAYRVFLTTYGKLGDELYFMLYNHETQEEAAQVSNQRVVFEPNAYHGSLIEPYSFEFNTKYNTLLEETICLGETYNENGFEASAAGSYFKRLIDENGNDSIVKLRLDINPTYRIEENVLVKQFPYEYDGTWIEEPGVHTFNYTSVHGCDSIMVCSFMYETTELMLIPNPADKQDRVLVLYNFTEEDKAGLVVEVYNNLGVKIQSIEPQRFPIELREINIAGSYVVRVVTGTGKVITAKLIVT